MALNTKSRSQELQTLAAEILAASGADVAGKVEIRPLAKIMSEKSGCHYTTAKQHIARAVRIARGKTISGAWGGKRKGAGRPKEEKEAR